MSRTARWAAIFVAGVGGTATKFFVAYAYSFTDGQGHTFAKPVLCMVTLFLGMTVLAVFTPCWPEIMRCVKQTGSASTMGAGKAERLLTESDSDAGGTKWEDHTASHVTWKLLRLFAFFAAMDAAATVCINVSLLYVVPALVASIRGLTTVWILVLQTYLVPIMPHSWFGKMREHRDVLVWRDWLGAALTVTGVAVAAITTVVPAAEVHHAASSSSIVERVSAAEAGIGIAFVVAGTLIQALQFLGEQSLLEDTGGLSAPAMVAYEGAFGCVYSLILLVGANFLPVAPGLSASLDNSGYLERFIGKGGTVGFIEQTPALLLVILGQVLGAAALCLGLCVLPSLGAGLAERTFALVGGRGAALVIVDVIAFQVTDGKTGLPPTLWLLGDVAAVLLIIAGGVFTALAQEERTARRDRSHHDTEAGSALSIQE
jgi:hypothetical protein